MDTVLGKTEPILVIEAPPRHGKTEFICNKLPAWFVGRWPDKRVILASHTADLAQIGGRRCRSAIQTYGEEYFGIRVSDERSSQSDWEIEGHAGGLFACGVGGAVVGRGANLLVIDDYIGKAEQAISQSFRDKQWRWWEAEAYERLEPGGVAIIMGTRWHEDDLIGRLVKASDTGSGLPVRRLRMPALAEENDVLGREPGEALWPWRRDEAWLQAWRDSISQFVWLAKFQQRPSHHENAEWPREYFGDHIWTDYWPHEFDLSAVGGDPSKGKNAKKGDFAANVFVGLKDGVLYVDADIRRCPPEVFVSAGVDLFMRHRAELYGLETNQFQELLVGEFNRQCTARSLVPLPIIQLNNTVNKELRIGRLGPYLQEGIVRFRSGSASCRLLVEQLKEFPLADHDDGPDAMEMAIRVMREGMESLSVESIEGRV